MKFSKTKYFLFACSVIFIGNTDNIKAQAVGKNYHAEWRKIDLLNRNKNFLEAAKTSAYCVKHGSQATVMNDAFCAAFNYALIGEIDKSFKHLKIAINKGKYYDLKNLDTLTAFINLRTKSQWNQLRQKALENNITNKRMLNVEWNNFLTSIIQSDQKSRLFQDSLRRNNASESEMIRSEKAMLIRDSLNLIDVINFIENNGWPSTNIIGTDGRDALFFVIQHSNIETMKKYLKTIEIAAKSDNNIYGYLCLIRDRISVWENQSQKYGTQYYLDPKTDEFKFFKFVNNEKIDKWRRKMGLDPIILYAKDCEIKYP
jgi:hypothetical protein